MIDIEKKFYPLLIEFDYKIINNASGQIVRAFWENVPEDLLAPSIVCAKKDSPFKSKWPLYEYESFPKLTRLGHALRKTAFPDIANQPDMNWLFWGRRVLRKIDNVLNKRQFDYIHSVSCPTAAHMVALEIKNRTGLPWIAQFHDPWIGNPSRKFRFSYFCNRFEQMEFEIAKNADFIIHTNSVILDAWRKRYGSLVEGKMVSLPLSFNTINLPKQIEKTEDGKLIMSHIGEIYYSRTLKDIVDAICEIRQEDIAITDKLQIQLIGRVKDSEKKYIHSRQLEKMFKFVGLLSPDKLEDYYCNSDAYLALDMKTQNSPCYPSKLMMYYYYRKPILGITTEGSIMEKDLGASGHHCYHYGDVKGIKSYLISLLAEDKKLYSFDHDYWTRFTVENAIKDYSDIVLKIVGDSVR